MKPAPGFRLATARPAADVLLAVRVGGESTRAVAAHVDGVQ